MIKTNQKITIEDEDIFANDLLDREDAISDLSKLIENQTEPLVLSVNADWGAGKTTFVQLWKTYLKTQGIESIYFSAWEDDFSDEPLIAILGELNSYISNNDAELKNDFEKTKKIASKIIPALMKLGANSATAGIAGESAEKTTKALIDNYQTNKNDLQKLKESIAEVLKTINPDKPFVIFIDELDRCKPLYAIELLERIKHIFDIERLIFVLSMDKNNLAKSIQSQYGNIDTDNYLRRFIHLEYPLKNPSVDKFCEVLFERVKLASILDSKNIYGDPTYGLDLIKALSSSLYLELSLRQIEQIFTKLHISFKTIPVNTHDFHLTIFILFECLKSDNSQLYDDFLAGNVTEIEVVPNINFRYSKYIKAVIAITPLRNKREALQDYIDKQTDVVYKRLLKEECSELLSHVNTVIKHIDFAEKFDFREKKN